MSNTYLSFVIGDELFAVNVSKVLEVLQKQIITKVPNAPGYIKGIINFRGEVVPVFETRTKFNLPERDQEKSYVIIVLDIITGTDEMRIGAIVDRVKDVFVINDTDIKPVPHMSSNYNTEFLEGIVKLDEKFTLLLNVDKVFTSTEVQQMINAANTQE